MGGASLMAGLNLTSPALVGGLPAPSAGGATLSGGTVTNITGWEVHKFTTSGTLTVTGAAATIEYLVCGGGGGSNIGGGGAGGMLEGSITLDPGTYAITIGAGGIVDTNGNNSSIAALVVAVGGGRGGGNPSIGGSGGNGGGGGGDAAGGSGTSGQGNNGGNGQTDIYVTPHHSWPSPIYLGGGGGGKNAAGGNYSADNGRGGSGKANSITGTSVTYCAGGDGSGMGPGTSPVANTGNGGNQYRSSGASGVVIVRIAV